MSGSIYRGVALVDTATPHKHIPLRPLQACPRKSQRTAAAKSSSQGTDWDDPIEAAPKISDSTQPAKQQRQQQPKGPSNSLQPESIRWKSGSRARRQNSNSKQGLQLVCRPTPTAALPNQPPAAARAAAAAAKCLVRGTSQEVQQVMLQPPWPRPQRVQKL